MSQPRRSFVRTLHADDAAALDQLGESGVMGEPPGSDAGPRASRLHAVLGLLGQWSSPEAPANLERRTLQRIRRAQPTEPLSLERSAGPGWAQVLASAAMLLLGASVLWPALAMNRSQARQAACLANLGAAGRGLAAYGADHDGALPRRGTWTGSPWWQVGKDEPGARPVHSNSAHLFLLIAERYLDPEELACPSNPDAAQVVARDRYDWSDASAVSYSYQTQFTSRTQHLARHAERPVLADKNPLFETRADELGFREDLSPRTPSRSHGDTGQNVLLGNGATSWQRDPRAGGDNMWLIEGRDRYEGTEVPDDPRDAFLVP
jgi:hypothetical protein